MLDADNSKNANYFSYKKINAPINQFDTFMTLKQLIKILLIFLMKQSCPHTLTIHLV